MKKKFGEEDGSRMKGDVIGSGPMMSGDLSWDRMNNDITTI